MRSSKQNHILILAGIVFLIFGLIAGVFLFPGKDKIKKVSFAPTPTEVPAPSEYKKLSPGLQETDSWKIFVDDSLKYSIKYPENIFLDERQTSRGRISVFVLEEDKIASLPGKVTALYLADTRKSGVNGFTAFTRGDCGSACKIPFRDVDWITFNNVYGVKNPLGTDKSNWFLTDKAQKGTVINAYVGGNLDLNEEKVREKVKLFEEMIKTINFYR